MRRLFLAFAVLGVLAVPAWADDLTLAVTGGTPLILPEGGVLGLDGPGVELEIIAVTDQRCPSDIECYWEGMIRVELTVTSGDIVDTLILCNACDDGHRDGAAAGYAFTLFRVDPARDALLRLDRMPVPSDYTLLLTVTAG